MRRLIVAALLVMLLAAPVAQAVSGPNQRSPDLQTADTVNDVAVAGDPEWIAAVADDPGSSNLNQDPDELVWYYWNEDPALLQAGAADRNDCDDQFSDNCQSDAVAVDVNEAGSRLVVASDTAFVDSDDTSSLILFIRDNIGEAHRLELPGNPVDVAISASGNQVAVLVNEVISSVPNQNLDAHVYFYNWPDGTSPPTLAWDDVEEAGGGTALAMSPDGDIVTVGVGKAHHWYTSTGAHTSDTSTKQGDVSALSISKHADHYALAGFASGEIALYSDLSKALPEHKLQYGTGSTAVTSVAIDQGGSVGAVGFDDGTLRIFSIDQSIGRLARTDAVSPGGGGINHVAISSDGTLVAAASGTKVTFYQVQEEGLLDSIWSATLPAAVTALDMQDDGEVVAASYSDRIAVFEASHVLDAAVPSSAPQVAPGASKNVTVTINNAGNRPEVASLSFDYEEGWFVQATPSSFRLDPGESVDVQVQIVVPRQPIPEAPGTYPVTVQHTTESGASGSKAFNVQVPLVRNQVIDWPLGPSIDVDPGTAVPFSLTVRNSGNEDDSVELQVTTSKSAWSASVSPNAFDLAPSEARTVTLEVVAPAAAASGDSAIVTLLPSGFPERKLQLTAVVGAAYGVAIDAPPSATIHPGNQTQVEIAIRNTGNAPDAYDVVLNKGQLPPGWSASFLTGQDTFFLDQVAAGDSSTVVVVVDAPATAELESTVVFSVAAESRGDSTQKDSSTVLVNVEAPPPETATNTGSRGTSAPGSLLVAAVLSLALLVRRRR